METPIERAGTRHMRRSARTTLVSISTETPGELEITQPTLPMMSIEPKVTPARKAAGGLFFDWMIVITSAWLTGGLFLDGWAHAHIPRLETFFTPWHAVLYSGFLAVALCHIVALVAYHRWGRAWRQAMPTGYGLSLLGIGIFALGGSGDLTWHLLFGIEKGVSALLSPTHLILALGGTLIVQGPFRAAWARTSHTSRPRLPALLPMILSQAMLLSVFAFFSQFMHPFVYVWSVVPASAVPSFYSQALGVASIELQTTLMMGIILLMLRRWRLPFGALTLVLTISLSLMTIISDHYWLIPVALLAGLAADLLVWWLEPSTTRVLELRIFAFTVPVILFMLYFLAADLLWGIVWVIHLTLGSVVMAGIVGLLLSYAFVHPHIAIDE
ncbi:MAG: hypothetical protein M3Z08_06770 [Chloroflexota bacterium]|nr:hypothetical protein [Chloroflexota bacterium]